MVSLDNGANWKYLQNNGATSSKNATPGIYDTTIDTLNPELLLTTITPAQFASSSTGEVATENIKMDVSSFIGKDVLFRIEGHRFDVNGNLIPTNYSYQQRTISVNN